MSHNDMEGTRVLVTGAGGFIGSHLTEELVRRGADVRAFVHYNANARWGWLDESPHKDDLEVILGDIRDRDTLTDAMKDVDIVFHLAALIAIPYSYRTPLSYVRTNVEGTLNVLETARALDTGRVVHTSTSEVYGTARTVPIEESHPLQGQSPYSASKIAADKMAESFYLSFGLPVATIRPFNTFGPRQSARAVIPTIITQALERDEVRLGSLHPTRDLNFVSDTVDAFIRTGTVDAAVGEVINVGTGSDVSIGDLANTIIRRIGRDVRVVSEDVRKRPPASEVERLLAANQKARDLLGWKPAFTLEQGLDKTIEWMRTQSDHYRPTQYTV